MSEQIETLNKSWGVFLKFKCKTETRDFETVESAMRDAGYDLEDRHKGKIERPTSATAFSRAVAYLVRTSMASVAFTDARHLEWKDSNDRVCSGDKNPNFSLKIEQVRKASTDTSVSYRINISDRTKGAGDMAHVLSVTYENGGLSFKRGTDQSAADEYGEDLEDLVYKSWDHFLNNYDDSDVRKIIVAEFQRLQALNVLGQTTYFVARSQEEAAVTLAKFVKATGHEAGLLGLDASEETRDTLISQLRDKILEELAELEEQIETKLNKKDGERKRGEKQRTRMCNTALDGIESVMALASYHQAVLGAIAADIGERADALRTKAKEFLTRDFTNPNAPVPAPKVPNVADVMAQAAALGLVVVPGGQVATPAAEVEADTVVADASDPFAVEG
jgi:hypothetical protein